MIYRPCAADVPGFCRQNQSLQIIAMRPPAIPQLADVFACRFFVDVEVGCLEETCCAEEQRLAVGNVFAQQPQRQTLREKSERQFVFLVTERGRNLLEKRFVASVHVDLVANPVRFLSQTELRRGVEYAEDVFFRQLLERRLAASWPRQRDICVERLRQGRRVDAHLRHVPIQMGAREKCAVTSFDEYMKHGRFEGWISRVTV